MNVDRIWAQITPTIMVMYAVAAGVICSEDNILWPEMYEWRYMERIMLSAVQLSGCGPYV